jgi:uncharacterized RDD family membrane protein YckC
MAQMNPIPTTDKLPPPAPILQRAAALIIDGIILFIGFVILSVMLGDTEVTSTTTFALLLVLAATYHIGFLTAVSATPGKVAMGLWVSDREGQRIRPDQAILRHLITASGNLSIISFELGLVFSLVTLVSIVMMLLDRKRRRALHDRIAGTFVVRGRPPQRMAY